MVGEVSGLDEFTKAMEGQRKMHVLLLMLRNGLAITGVAFVALACGILAKEENPALDGSSMLWIGTASMVAMLMLTMGITKAVK